MSRKFNLYLGKAGQLATMSYFLLRGWNVATPEVDVGDDLFVVEDEKGIFFRVQVKTAQSLSRKTGFGAKFSLPLKQLRKAIDPEVYYVFLTNRQDDWSYKIIVPRSALFARFQKDNIGSIIGDNLLLYFTFEANKVMCSGVDFSEFYNNFDDFPRIAH
jgi:hypothetical protein